MICIVATTCSAPDTTPPATTSTEAASDAASPAGDAIFRLIKPDGAAVDFTLDDLKALPLISIFSEGSPEEGPALLDVIKAGSIMDFREVTVTGVDGTYTLARDAITPEVVLDFNNRGGVKLVSPDLPRDRRVRDIFKIEVR
jgi:hypothetical protein